MRWRLAAMVSLKIQLNDLPGAMAVAEEALKENPGLSAGYLLSGNVQLAQKQYEQAIESFQQAYKLRAGQEAVMGLYKARTLLGQHAQAQAVMQDWLVHPEDNFIRRNLAVAYFDAGEVAAARREFEQLYDQGEHSPVVLAHLARIYDPKGYQGP